MLHKYYIPTKSMSHQVLAPINHTTSSQASGFPVAVIVVDGVGGTDTFTGAGVTGAGVEPLAFFADLIPLALLPARVAQQLSTQ